MRKLFLITMILLPLMTACSDDEIQSNVSGYPIAPFPMNSSSEEGSSAGVSVPNYTDIGDDR